MGYLSAHSFAPFIVVSTTYRALRYVYGGVYIIKGHGEKYLYQK
jgi:hypothetical protein